MVLELIKKQIENYKTILKERKLDEVYKWISLKNFQDKWNIEAEDFRSMYDYSFKNPTSSNLWANPHWFPKSVMLQFIDFDKERVRKMFKELFDETIEIENRVSKFVYHCDCLRNEIYENDKSMKNHFHDGQRMVSLYLAFKYPKKYAIYKYTEFKTFMEVVKAKDIPRTGELERFFKVVRTLQAIITKNDELVALQQSELDDTCYEGETLMLAQDFIFRVARQYM